MLLCHGLVSDFCFRYRTPLIITIRKLTMLQAAVVEQEVIGTLLISIQKITYLTHRCMVYENIYNSETTQADVLSNLHSTLVELYTAILRIIALANKMFTKSTLTRGLHALVNPRIVLEQIAKCQELETRIELDATNCDRLRYREVDAVTRKLIESLKEPIVRTDERVALFLEIVGDDERLKILDWICDIPHGKSHDTLSGQRTQDTCNWLIERHEYQEWQDTSSSTILWLHGTGKF